MRNFNNDDWMGFAGAAGAPQIEIPSLNKHLSAHVAEVSVVADQQGVGVSILALDDEMIHLMYSVGGKDAEEIGDEEPPSAAFLSKAEKALTAIKFAKNHVELVGALALDGFEVL